MNSLSFLSNRELLLKNQTEHARREIIGVMTPFLPLRIDAAQKVEI